ncbi:MAG: DUF1501 domain-containing protein [Pseudomonadota bacterium]
MISRRHFLQSSGAALSLSPFASMGALAADTSGYKALVCVFLFGGCDTHDVLIGQDVTSYNTWADSRSSILDAFAASSTPTARDRTSLLTLNPTNAADYGSRTFGMPPEMSGLHGLFESGNAAIVPNVGPLIEPTNRQGVVDKTATLPGRLQSHNDQQSTWQSFGAEGTGTGWGGRILDAVAEASPFSAMSINSNAVFLSGDQTQPVSVAASGNVPQVWPTNTLLHGSSTLPGVIRDYYRTSAQTAVNPMMRDIIAKQASAIEDGEALITALAGQTLRDSIVISGNSLSEQLGTIANIIGARGTIGASRQVFFASMGGFDTHNSQASTLPVLLERVSEAITSFQTAIDGAGLANDVTLFTASDFGRTLTANATGTDHGWGSHHFVVGGAVNGQQIHGDVPVFDAEHDQDLKRGALIPQISVDQYGAELASWFGLTNSEINMVFPNLGNFDTNALQLF